MSNLPIVLAIMGLAFVVRWTVDNGATFDRALSEVAASVCFGLAIFLSIIS